MVEPRKAPTLYEQRRQAEQEEALSRAEEAVYDALWVGATATQIQEAVQRADKTYESEWDAPYGEVQ